MKTLVETLNGAAIFAQEDFSPFARKRDRQVVRHLPLTLVPGQVLHHPQAVLKPDGTPYVVYTPYKNKWYEKRMPSPSELLISPDALPTVPVSLQSVALPSTKPVDGFPATAEEAQTRLPEFIGAHIRDYRRLRDRMDLDGTSRLSPYLRFGLVSVRECFVGAQVKQYQATDDQVREEIRTWMDELVWREFYTAILYHFPEVMGGPFRKNYAKIPWRDSADDLRAWQQGQTGYPIVDACMRQLLSTGWMHNRGRMIAASFLTKDLLINWQEGESWFMANLIDGDPAANNGGWQWSAGTGTDAAPYFRVFNPVAQGRKFDPEGDYIARWVPELAKLPAGFRHEPWRLTPEEARHFGFTFGKDYPERVVDHAFVRERALLAYRSSRKQ